MVDRGRWGGGARWQIVRNTVNQSLERIWVRGLQEGVEFFGRAGRTSAVRWIWGVMEAGRMSSLA